jgi:thiosulfate/3-mercaptopyruvate sulfurtransferase
MGFTNIAVLDGGFPAWNSKKYPIEKHQIISLKGNFIM